MAIFVQIHGVGSVAVLAPDLSGAAGPGPPQMAPDLPFDNDTARLNDHACTVTDALADWPDPVIVGQS